VHADYSVVKHQTFFHRFLLFSFDLILL
jgi:hypothetical protein